MRDSKDPDGPRLEFTAEEWHAFVGGVNEGAFDGFRKKSPSEQAVSCSRWLAIRTQAEGRSEVQTDRQVLGKGG